MTKLQTIKRWVRTSFETQCTNIIRCASHLSTETQTACCLHIFMFTYFMDCYRQSSHSKI